MHPVLPRVLRTCALGAALLLAAAGAARPLPGEPPPLRVTRMDAPARAVVTDAAGAWVATFTDGARTVALAGPERTFAEPAHTAATVTHGVWVRLLPAPFEGRVDQAWLAAARADTAPDLLAVALQYVHGAPRRRDPSGRRLAGDAHYGPVRRDGGRDEGSDFNDYLGRRWRHPDGVDRPEWAQRGSLDCSGFVRMVFGYRGGLPMARAAGGPQALPRRAHQMADAAPGLVLAADTAAPPAPLHALAPGDLVFFDAAADDGARIDHVGIYLGVDSGGRRRFLSSRKGADGPTMGDTGGRSLLDAVDGRGLYARAFRAARRL